MNKNIFKGLFAALLCMATVFSYAQTNQRYYWVGQGGNGNWGNLENWAFVSGGNIHPSVVPGATNTVIFDGNSGLTASNKTINIVGNTLCDSLIIELSAAEAPVFNFANTNSNIINVFGSFLNYKGATAQNSAGNAGLCFNSSKADESVLLNNFFYPSIVYNYVFPTWNEMRFEGTARWHLLGDMCVATMSVNRGILDCEGYTLSCGEIYIRTPGKIVITNSTIYTRNWEHTNTAADALTSPESTGSRIVIGTQNFKSRTNQVYNNLEITAFQTASEHSIYGGTFNKVTIFEGVGRVSISQSVSGYSSTIDSLIIESTAQVMFGRTTVNKLFRGKPTTCGGQVIFRSNDAANKNIYFLELGASAAVDVQRAIIYNLHVTGKQLKAEKSYDWGGNSGSIDIEEWTPTGHNMYWIGSGGNWNDPAHWSLSNGGPSADCVPTLADDVFFTSLSGNLDANHPVSGTETQGYCHNLTASGLSAVAVMPHLIIGGSLDVQSNFNSYYANYTFVSDQNEIIDFHNSTQTVPLDRAYVFRSINGTGHWKFMSNPIKAITITLDRGSLDMSGLNNLNISGFQCTNANQNNTALGLFNRLSSRWFDISNSTIKTNGWISSGGEIVTEDRTDNSLIQSFNDAAFSVTVKNGDRYNNLMHNGANSSATGTLQSSNSGTAYFNKIILDGTVSFQIGSNSATSTAFIAADSVVFSNDGTLYVAEPNFNIYEYLGSPDNCTANPKIRGGGSYTTTITMGNTILPRENRVKLYNATITDINITTSVPDGDYLISNSILAGTTNGWQTTEAASKTLYWVGGTGNWSDSKHWSIYSGLNGGAYDDGTACAPSFRDDVIFDNGSFIVGGGTQSVNIDVLAVCNNMTWLQTEDCGFMPRLMWNVSASLGIYGSLELQKTMAMGSNSVAAGTKITSIGFQSTRPNETVKTNGFVNSISLNEWWSFRGQGTTYTFPHDFDGATTLITLATGYNVSLDMSGKNFRCYYITGNNNNINVSNGTFQAAQHLTITGVLHGENTTFRLGTQISATGSNIHLDNANIYAATDVVISPSPSPMNNIYLTGSATHQISLSNCVMNKLQVVQGNAVFNYSLTTDTLILANNTGNIYTFKSNYTFTVNKAYYGSGTPCNPIYLRSFDEAPTNRPIFDFKRPTANYDNVFATDWADTLLIDYAYIHGIVAKTNDNNAMLMKGIHAPDQDKSGSNEAAWGYGDGTGNNNVAWAAAQPFVNDATPFPAELDLPCTAWGSKFSCKTYFLPNYASTFKWRKGTKNDPVVSEEIYVVLDEEAQYVCTVDYGNGCTYTDSVNIIMTPADTLVWVGANRDYYNLANWTIRNNGLPAIKLPDGCTDIYIPAGLTNYPDLSPGITNYGQEFYETAAAKNIWFDHGGDAEAGGELVRPDSLHYSKAFVNVRLKSLRWYNLTAPLMDMYSGDFAFDHINPLVEMRLFKTESPQNGEMAVADWTTPFSTDTVRLKTIDGFSVRVGSVYYPDDQFWPDKDWGLMEGAVSVNIADTVWQFPKDNTHWDFYHERTKEKVGQAQDLPGGEEGGGRNYAGKFIFESQKGSLNPGMVAQKIIPDGYATSEVIIGNPFMSHFDFADFYRENHLVILPQFKLLKDGGSYQAFSAVDNDGPYGDGEFDVSPPPAGIDPIIAPMQSIIVTLRSAVPTFYDQPIYFTDIMSISNTTPSGILRKPTLTENRLASISASRGLYSSEAFVQTSQEAHNAFAEGEDALLLKSEGLSNLAIDVFTVADGKYLSVNRINEEFDTIHIGLMTKSNKGLTTITLKDIPTLSEDEQYFFEDKALAMTLPITDNEFSYQFDNQVGNVLGRFAIYKTPAIVNGVQDPKATDNGAQAFIYGDMLNVVSKDGSAIQAIMIYDTKGVLIYENQNVNSTSWQMPAAKVGSQVLIVKVVTTNGAYAIKVISNK